MPKKHDAFAFRGFDSSHILQRPYFRAWREEFHFADTASDEEILAALRANDTDKNYEFEAKLDALDALLIRVKKYFDHIDRHARRLAKLAGAVAGQLVTDENSRRRYTRGRDLLEILKQYPYGARSELTDGDNFIQFSHVNSISENFALDNLYREIQLAARAVEDEIKRRIRMTFAARLKAARKNEGLTQSQLAALLRVTRRVVAAYESGEIAPSLTTLVRCAHTLRKPADWLLGIEP